MARYTGDTNLALTYDVTYWGPLDSRMLVGLKSDLINESTWIAQGQTENSAYDGMLVAVAADTEENNGIYFLKDYTELTSYSAWIKLATLSEVDSLAERLQTVENSFVANDTFLAYLNALKQQIIDSHYLTQEQLLACGYITGADLENYATHSYVLTKIAEAALSGTDVDLSGYATKDDLSLKADKSYVDNSLKYGSF